MTSEAERKFYLNEHLRYEMFMLRYTAQTLPLRAQLDWNVCVESLTVHARNLYLFLTNDKDAKNFKARDFVEKFNVRKDDTKGIFERINRQVLHLGKARRSDVAGKISPDDVVTVSHWLEKHFMEFVGELKEPYCWNEVAATPPKVVLLDTCAGADAPSATNHIGVVRLQATEPLHKMASAYNVSHSTTAEIYSSGEV
ncbi:MAG: hypothetical protein ACLPID_12420 [Beijerinckiaceae bacterium]